MADSFGDSYNILTLSVWGIEKKKTPKKVQITGIKLEGWGFQKQL